MKEVLKLKMSSDKPYLSQNSSMRDIPAGIFIKNKVGCGSTTIVLENGINYIIAVPTCALIHNKQAKYKEAVLCFMSDSLRTPDSVNKYLNDPRFPIKKILVTYDSLPKLLEIISPSRMKDFQICIDDFHCIVKAYTYRSEAIWNMLISLNPYKDKVRLISVTPISIAFLPDCWQDVNYTEVEWESSNQVSVECVYVKKVIPKVASIINDYRNGQSPVTYNNKGELVASHEAFFFVNCINDIIQIIKAAELQPEETRIVCSETDANISKIPPKFSIARILDREKQLKEIHTGKRFSFITATAFEGLDFFSPTAVTYVISNIDKRRGFGDIASDIKVIAGRIRDDQDTYGVNPFKGITYHIHNSDIIDGGKEGFIKEMEKAKSISEKHIKLFNNDPETYRTMIINGVGLVSPFYCAKMSNTGVPYYDHVRESALRYQFEQVLSAYESGFSVREEHEKSGRNVTFKHDNVVFDCPSIKPNKLESTFETRLSQYKDLLANYDETWAIKQFENDPKNKVCVLAYKYLGETKIKALKYREGAVKKELISKMMSGTVLAGDVYKTFQIGQRYSRADIKDRMKKLYEKHFISGTPKASDLNNYFNTKSCKMSDRSEGFEIISLHTKAQKEAEQLRLTMEQMGMLDESINNAR